MLGWTLPLKVVQNSSHCLCILGIRKEKMYCISSIVVSEGSNNVASVVYSSTVVLWLLVSGRSINKLTQASIQLSCNCYASGKLYA